MGLEKCEASKTGEDAGGMSGDVHGGLWVPGVGICSQGTVTWVTDAAAGEWGSGTGWARGRGPSVMEDWQVGRCRGS